MRFSIAPPMPERDSLEFSFSGIKTSVARWVERNGVPSDEAALADLCASFQRRIVEVLVRKTMVAARRERVSTVVLGGGVAANSELRGAMASAGAVRELSVVVPQIANCTDNAAMIAFAGVARLANGEDDTGRLEVNPATLLPRVTRKGRGRR
jgi:N6-L-threonylcarbamoyladenine synthase